MTCLKKITYALTAGLLIICLPLQAEEKQSGNAFGIGFQRLTIVETELNAVQFKFMKGLKATDTGGFGIEGHFLLPISKGERNFYGIDVEVEIKSAIGVFGNFYRNISPTSTLYGLLGYSTYDTGYTYSGFNASIKG